MSNSRKPFREQSLAENIVFIDGISGSGKSMIAPLISTFQRGELWMLNHIFEYLLIMHSLDEISLDAAQTLMKIYIDHDSYHLMIGRNINFRATDDSSAQKNNLGNIYKKRMNQTEGDDVMIQMKKDKPINIFMTHYIFHESQPLFSALDERLKLFIVPVRHPYWLIENWLNQDWDRKMGANPRDLAIVYKHKENIYPWHAKGWENLYDSLNRIERAIETINRLSVSEEEIKDNFSNDERKKILIIPFELFALNPNPFIKEMTAILDSSITDQTESVMKSMNLPREINPNIFNSKKDELLIKCEDENVSTKYKDLLLNLADNYEKKYLGEIINE